MLTLETGVYLEIGQAWAERSNWAALLVTLDRKWQRVPGLNELGQECL